jgi:hypothetical protein
MRRRKVSRRAAVFLVAVLAAVAAPVAARAQWDPLAETAEQVPGSFLTLARMGETSAIGVGTSVLVFAPPADLDTAMRIDVYGRWRSDAWGLYGQLSWAHISWRNRVIPGSTALVNDMTAASDLELGATYSLRFQAQELSARAGVLLPTASNLQFAANLGVALARVDDVAALTPASLWLRPGLTLRGSFAGRAVFYQLDASVCVPFHTNDDFPSDDPIWTFAAAVGGNVARFEATAELANAYLSYATLHTIAFTASYRIGGGGGFRPYLGYVRPFGADLPNPPTVVSAGVNGVW